MYLLLPVTVPIAWHEAAPFLKKKKVFSLKNPLKIKNSFSGMFFIFIWMKKLSQ